MNSTHDSQVLAKNFSFPQSTRKIGALLTACTLALFFTACATVGSSFEFKGPESIVVGQTTETQIIAQYGQPFRVGYENGNVKWTYGYYHYRLFGDSDTKDFSVTFGKNGTVVSYEYSSSDPKEVAEGTHAAK